MRLVSTVLFVALTGAGVARSLADEAKPADPQPEVTKKKVPYRVVKMLPETRQVLLFDRDHGTHVVAEVGQSLDGYVVDSIDEDEVTLFSEAGAQIILTTPPPPPPPRVTKRTASKKAAPVDPYVDHADAAATADQAPAQGGAPIDPYAEPEVPSTPGEGGVRVASAADPSTATASPETGAAVAPTATASSAASADPTTSPSTRTAPPPPAFVDVAPDPSDPYGDPAIAAFADAVAASGAPDAAPANPVKPTKQTGKAGKRAASDDAAAALATAATGTPAPAASGTPATDAADTPATAAPAAPAARGGAAGAAGDAATVTIARGELDADLADFGKLAGSFKATFTPDGLRFDAIEGGTLLAKVGLRRGDLITYVDGQPLRSLDDAATLYARAGTVEHTTLQIVRDGRLVTLRVAIL